jgi:DNA-directed RNA polymerase subunit L
MNVKIMGKGKNKLRVEFEGEDHTLLNLLRQNLWEEGVDYAAYEKEHPFLTNPVLILETDKKNPTRTLKAAAKRMGNQMQDFRKEFGRALKR